jgi:hypothetical protein
MRAPRSSVFQHLSGDIPQRWGITGSCSLGELTEFRRDVKEAQARLRNARRWREGVT